MTDILTTTLCVSVHRKGDNPVYGETATHINLDDESGGAFFVLSQGLDEGQMQQIRLDYDELDTICGVARAMKVAYEHACNARIEI